MATLLRPHLSAGPIAPGYDKFAALQAACWSGGTLLYVPARRGRRSALSRPFGPARRRRRFGPLPGGARRRRRGHAAGRNRRPRPVGRRAALRRRRVAAGARLAAALREPAKLGRRRLAFRPSKGAGRPRRLVAMDHRRAGQPPGQGQSARGPGRPDAAAQVNGVMFTDGRQHLSYHTLQHHQAPHCTSDLLYKGALQGSSRIVWRGMIKVDRDAQKTDGYQRNDNLILSESSAPIRSRAWRSRPTTSSARTAPRPVALTTSRSSTPRRAA